MLQHINKNNYKKIYKTHINNVLCADENIFQVYLYLNRGLKSHCG